MPLSEKKPQKNKTKMKITYLYGACDLNLVSVLASPGIQGICGLCSSDLKLVKVAINM